MARKVIIFGSCLLLAASTLFAAIFMVSFPGVVRGDTYYVTPGDSIQAAVDGASAGDTVFIYTGTYYESVVIPIPIKLVGENQQTTIIDGGGSSKVVYIDGTDYVEISTLRIKNGDVGINIFQSSTNRFYFY